MSSTKQKLRLAGAFAALATLALAISCRGFFVNPTLTSLSVAPSTATIDAGTTNNTVQMHATGNFNDGSTGSASVSWTIVPASGGPTAANINTSGLVTSTDLVGSMTVTATAIQSASITGTATINVVPPNLVSITINPTGTVDVGVGLPEQFSATGVDSAGNSYDITDIATWVSTNTNAFTIDADGNATASSTAAAGSSSNITASLDNVTSRATTLVISQ
jgi:hypothetical protein